MADELSTANTRAKEVKTSAANGETEEDAKATKVMTKHPVFCLPAADEADENRRGDVGAGFWSARVTRANRSLYKTLANEMVTQVADAGATVVCISATPPHDTLHTKYLCKLLRSRLPTLHIIVGLWDAEVDEAKLTRRRDQLAADGVVTTLDSALEQIRPLAVLELEAVHAAS